MSKLTDKIEQLQADADMLEPDYGIPEALSDILADVQELEDHVYDYQAVVRSAKLEAYEHALAILSEWNQESHRRAAIQDRIQDLIKGKE